MTDYKPGKLVTFRGREWVVLPSTDRELVILRPLGGPEEETTAVFLPLRAPGDEIGDAIFPDPSAEDMADFHSARMLFDASRLSFRNASGPFRCMGKLSFRPRSYQLVPLIMALRQQTVRLLVADDVGIGKTVEALIILKEMMERGEVKRFAVVCLPHLCDQWKQELKDKLDIGAEIIRSSTAASLDRRLPDDRSVFYHFPYQVISIDYIKAEKRRNIFISDCPELLIVDEAHTCARPAPAGAKPESPGIARNQQQRYALLDKIAKNEKQHLILLTATPHSGKDAEFQSLLGLLNSDFEKWDFGNLDQGKRKKIAKHFVQRKRTDIRRWLGEDTPFPNRDSKELSYVLSAAYEDFYRQILTFARGLKKDDAQQRPRIIRYWAALALLRGAMSSPAAAQEMLQNRQQRQMEAEALAELADTANPLFEISPEQTDVPQFELLENAGLEANQLDQLEHLCRLSAELHGTEKDWKAQTALNLVKKWLKDGFQPIVFCKYIATANYIGKLLRDVMPAKTDVQVITSELADEQRREKIQQMAGSEKRVLVATDCLSEGINLQDLFTAVLHYDLPWNPNRIEQREGRVDRFGQQAETVETCLMLGQNNPIDQVVWKVLIGKVREIQRATGVSITLGEENISIMDKVIENLLESETPSPQGMQMTLFAQEQISNELESTRKKAENLRSIFAHETIQPHDIEENLIEIDEAIGDLQSVERFVNESVTHLGGRAARDGRGFSLDLANLPPHIRVVPGQQVTKVSFESPTPAGYRYLGRNHRFVEQLCQYILRLAFEKSTTARVARVSVIRTEAVTEKTTLFQFRVRNVIREVSGSREVISEEIYLWGYSGIGEAVKTISYEQGRTLLLGARSVSDLAPTLQNLIFEEEKTLFEQNKERFNEVAKQRAEHLVKAHDRFKEHVGGRRYEAVYPVLPPDLMGIYILLPVPKALF